MDIQSYKRVFLALDMDVAKAVPLVEKIKEHLAGVKIGKEMFTRHGPEIITLFRKMGMDVFSDLKYHDIPNTVAKAVAEAVGRNASIINLHCAGGRKMMSAAVEATETKVTQLSSEFGRDWPRPLIVGVTVLTSLSFDDLYEVGEIGGSLTDPPDKKAGRVRELVLKRAKLAKECGLNGVVCSPLEAKDIRIACGPDFQIITPGIRMADATTADDQKRIATPGGAIEFADWLVIGRPIYEAASPKEVLKQINEEVKQKLIETGRFNPEKNQTGFDAETQKGVTV